MKQARWLVLVLTSLTFAPVQAQEFTPIDLSRQSLQTAKSLPDHLPPTNFSNVPLTAVLGAPESQVPTRSGEPKVADKDVGVPAASQPGEQAALQDPSESKLGPSPVHESKILQDFLRKLFHQNEWMDPSTGKVKDPAIKIYGWLDMGYTYSSSGNGPLSVEPRPNRFGREFSINQLALTIEKPIDPKELSWGFVFQPYAGADAALYNPIRGALIKNPDPRFGLDIRNLYLQAHLPILTEGGVDVEIGHHYPLLGYQSAMAPYRTFYSNDYQWFYGEAAAFTGLITTCHVNKQLDVVNALTLGYLTFFNSLSVAPTYMGRIDYWLQPERKTLISLGCVTGPASPHSSANTTLTDVTLTQNWNKHFTQVVQFNSGYSERGTFEPGLERFYSLYNLFLYHATPCLDVNFRVEWYHDVDGRNYPGGTGFQNHYEELTLGLDYHPTRWLQIRPELRADFANQNAPFGPVGGPYHRNQWTPAIECLMKF